LSVTELKKVLKQQTKEELISLLTECYKSNDKIKEFISARYAGKDTVKQLYEVYKEKIHNSFFPVRGDTLKLAEARKAITGFKKLCSDDKLILDLMLYYVEMGVEFTNTYGDIDEDFNSSIESMYASVIKTLNKQDAPSLYHEFQTRLEAVMDDTQNIGWGFHEALFEWYYNNNLWYEGKVEEDE
jgi:hypothetical protein